MLKVIGNKVMVTRGDTAYVTLIVDDYTLKDTDTVSVQVRDKPNDGKLMIDGETSLQDDGSVVWHIKPSDTKNCRTGIYVWDAQIKTIDGDIYTFIPSSTFKIMDEVTMDG